MYILYLLSYHNHIQNKVFLDLTSSSLLKTLNQFLILLQAKYMRNTTSQAQETDFKKFTIIQIFKFI